MNEKFQFSIEGKPDFSLLTVNIPAGKTLKVEASAMASMDTNLSMKTRFKGGFSRLFTGESLFINEFTAQNGAGEIKIAPGAPGDLIHHYLNNETIYIQNSGYVASSPAIDLNMKWQGLKGFFTGEGLFLVKCSGTGDLWLNSYGGIVEVDVKDAYVVDTGHIVAFTEGLSYRVKSIGGYKSFFFSGEGLVCHFSGQGKVWIQSRKINPFAGWLHPFRPQKSNN
jgi:uncharacterized protein (TIGR00266 family)